MTRILAAEPIPSFSRQAGSFLVCRHLPHKGVWSQRDVATQAAKGTAGLHEKKYKILKSVFTSPYGLLLVLFCLDVRTTTHDILVLVLPVFCHVESHAVPSLQSLPTLDIFGLFGFCSKADETNKRAPATGMPSPHTLAPMKQNRFNVLHLQDVGQQSLVCELHEEFQNQAATRPRNVTSYCQLPPFTLIQDFRTWCAIFPSSSAVRVAHYCHMPHAVN